MYMSFLFVLMPLTFAVVIIIIIVGFVDDLNAVRLIIKPIVVLKLQHNNPLE